MNNPDQAMKIISRADAKAQGLTRYYTGKPCKHGHVSERQASDGGCMECRRLHQKAYMRTDAGKAATKRHSQTEKRRAARRETQRRYSKTEAGKAREERRHKKAPHRAPTAVVKRNYPLAIVPLTEVEQQRVEGIYRFANALRQRTNHGWDVDHCYPLSRGGVHHPDNLQVLPASVNRQKRDKVDPANPSVLKGFLASFPHAAERLKQKRKAGRTPLMIGEMNKGQRVRPAL